MELLITGGAGYIGSHAAQRALADGHRVVVLDNLDRGHLGAVERLRARAGEQLRFVEGDFGDERLLERVFSENQFDAVLHFAALTYVGESVAQPVRYYQNNTGSAATLLEAVDAAGVERFIFSSTAATYGEPGPEHIPIRESCPQAPMNPYGRSKLATEHMLADLSEAKRRAGQPFAAAALRYFNVAGADRTGLLGEDHDPETHLIPVILQAALGRRDAVNIFGTDYDTPDGTCVRDYVHVEDLVDAHMAVMGDLDPDAEEGARRFRAFNLGIGRGYSVLEIIEAVREVTGASFTVREGERRPGDPPTLFADASKIAEELGWRASVTDLGEIIDSAWRWFKANPNGYS